MTIPADSDSESVTVTALDNAIVEGNETLTATIATNGLALVTPATGYDLASSTVSAVVTIADNDQALVSVSSAGSTSGDVNNTAKEADTGDLGKLIFTLSKKVDVATKVTFKIPVVSTGAGLYETDFELKHGTTVLTADTTTEPGQAIYVLTIPADSDSESLL